MELQEWGLIAKEVVKVLWLTLCSFHYLEGRHNIKDGVFPLEYQVLHLNPSIRNGSDCTHHRDHKHVVCHQRELLRACLEDTHLRYTRRPDGK